METGEPKGQRQVPGRHPLQRLEVADDGTIYATQTGDTGSDHLAGLQDHAAGQSSVLIRARRSTCPTASPSTPRATSWSSTSAPTTFYLLARRQAAHDRAVDRPGQRRHRDVCRRHQVREQRAPGHGVAHPPGPEGRDHRLGHPERGVDDLRLEAQPAGDPDERLERHHDSSSSSNESRPGSRGSGLGRSDSRSRISRSRCERQANQLPCARRRGSRACSRRSRR